jgi:acyl-CoA thioester hydrolase
MIVKSKVVLRYSDTDQMGVIHHSIYAQYLEQGRMDFFKALGFDYVDIEKEGIIFPVYNINITYKNAIRLDESMQLVTKIERVTPVKIVFTHELVNDKEAIKATATSTIVCVDKATFKLVKMPDVMGTMYKEILKRMKNLDD